MRWIVYAFGFALVAATLLVAGAGACQATDATCTINPGDTIYVEDLPEIEEGMPFRMEIENAVAVCENGRFEISLENFTTPSPMEDMTIQLEADEASTIGLQVTKDGMVRDLTREGNEIEITSFDCPGGETDSMTFYGTCCQSDSEVVIDLIMEGTVGSLSGTSPDEFSFEIYGITDGLTDVSVELGDTAWTGEVTVTSDATGDGECRLTLA